LLRCEVYNNSNEIVTGKYVSFTDTISALKFFGVTNKYGWFEIYIPKNKTYKVLIEGFNKIESERFFDTGEIDYLTYRLSIQKETSNLLNIVFENNSSKIIESSFKEIDVLYEWMLDKKNLTIEIGGHTDNIGTNSFNMKLSQERAESVRSYLIEKGIDPDLIIAKGYGETIPIGDNETELGRMRNRRTEIKFLADDY
tara:strand:- start:1581 stop:2174 length:594 start_codon:yes stop_codon:yes gene_type:complete